jgi:predicted porin
MEMKIMQKKIIVLAIATLASTSAFADVSVYGILDAGYGDTNKTLTTPVTGATTKSGQEAIAFSQMVSSRLGFSASQEVGNGMKALVKVETGIGSNPMAGVAQTGTKAIGFNGTTLDATTLGNRELNASLMFATGTTIKAGFGSTPVRDFSLSYDASAASFGGNLVGNLLNNDATLSSNRQTSIDVIQQFGPVKATVSVSHNTDYNDTTASTTKNNGYLAAAQYVDGAASVGVAYQKLGSYTPGGTTFAFSSSTGAIASTTTVAADITTAIAMVGGSYDLGMAKLFAEYANIKTDDAQAATETSTVGVGTRSYESVGVELPFGAALVFAQYSAGSVNQVTKTGVAANSRKTTGYTIGAKYNFNKMTAAYASLGNTKLDSDVGAGDTGIEVKQIVAGLVYKF